MPIDYSKYPPNWKSEIRHSILERASHCCEVCGVKNYVEGFRCKQGKFYTLSYVFNLLDTTGEDMCETVLSHCLDKDGKAKPIKIVLTIAHLDHNIQNNDYRNLKAMCQRCHLHHDKDYHLQNRKVTQKKKRGIVELF